MLQIALHNIFLLYVYYCLVIYYINDNVKQKIIENQG